MTDTTTPTHWQLDAAKRARAYVTAMGPAVEGQGGDNKTYTAACRLVKDFGLSGEEALEILREWNLTCVPPWADRDLVQKVTNAQKYARGELFAKLDPQSHPTFGDPSEALDALVAARAEGATGGVIPWLAWELDDVLPWNRRARRWPTALRQAALLAAVDAFLSLPAEERPASAKRLQWIVDEAARRHYACDAPNASRRWEGIEVVLRPLAKLDAMATPQRRDGCTHAAVPAPTEGNDAPAPSVTRVPLRGDGTRGYRRRALDPSAHLPENPETLYAHKEARARFRDTLSPLERDVLDAWNWADSVLAEHRDTTTKTIKTTRTRIYRKAKSWAINEKEEHGMELSDLQSVFKGARRGTGEEGLKKISRPMSPAEAGDAAADYDGSEFRARDGWQQRLIALHGLRWWNSPKKKNRWQGELGKRVKAEGDAKREAEKVAQAKALGEGPFVIVGLRDLGRDRHESQHFGHETFTEGVYPTARAAMDRIEELRARRAPGDPVIHAIRRAQVVPANQPQQQDAHEAAQQAAAAA